MKCINPKCNFFKTEIVDSRQMKQGFFIRRRHYCYKCQTLYTSLEIPIYVGKVNSKSRQLLNQVIYYFEGADPYSCWQQFLNSNYHE